MKFFLHGGGCGDACCLRVQNLHVHIGEDRILENVNLHVHCGEMLALIGPNGAGKSTILKSITRQLKTISGTVTTSSPGKFSLSMPRAVLPYWLGSERSTAI